MPTTKYCRPDDCNAFQVAIICALQTESDAVEVLFDEFWEDDEKYDKALGDPNSYTLGRIGQHNAVLAYMPGMGRGASASLAASFRSTFPSITLGLVVGICGGVPHGASHSNEILLGDVVVSTGVVQFDFGRQFSEALFRKDTLLENLGRPNPAIRGFLNKMQGWHARTELRKRILEYVVEICSKAGFEGWKYPGLNEDKLYQATYRHKHQDQCSEWMDWSGPRSTTSRLTIRALTEHFRQRSVIAFPSLGRLTPKIAPRTFLSFGLLAPKIAPRTYFMDRAVRPFRTLSGMSKRYNAA